MKTFLMDAGAVALGVFSLKMKIIFSTIGLSQIDLHGILSNAFLAVIIYLVCVRIRNAKKNKKNEEDEI